MSLFGEIIEPSSRALFGSDDENENEAEDKLCWEQEIQIPKDLNTLIIAEGKAVVNIFKKSVLNNAKAVCDSIEAAVTIYKLQNGMYVALYTGSLNSSCGEITEFLLPWILNAPIVISFQSQMIVEYQSEIMDKPMCLIRMLNHKTEYTPEVPMLEQPNIVTGVGAGAISYRIHTNKPGCLYIFYFDALPLDSSSAQPAIKLLERLQIPMQKYVPDKIVMNSNLYI